MSVSSAARSVSSAARPFLALAVVLAGACADGDDDLPSDTRAPVVDSTTPDTVARPTTTTEPPLEPVDTVQGVTVGLEEVATLDGPVAMAVRPGVDDRVYVAERGGRIVDLGLADGDVQPVLDLSDQTTTESERGLLGIAVSPDGERLYVSYTNVDGDSRIDEYALAEDGSVDEGSRRAVFALDQPFPNHNGGHITFGPDGQLYVGFGDGGAAGDPLQAGQDRDQLLGSILRIDPSGSNGSAYAVPRDNPHVGEDQARPEVWLKGVRNPWRFTFDRGSGDLWIGDVGQNAVEEIDRLPAGADGTGAGRGANLGWNRMEGDRPFEDGTEPADHTPPVFTYEHADGGCAVTGGYVYRGSAVPELAGAYLYADHCLGEVRALAVDDGEVVDQATIAGPVAEPVSFGQGPDAELYLLSLAGPLYRLVPP